MQIPIILIEQLTANITTLPISGAPEQERRTIPTTFCLLKIFLTEQLYKATLHGKTKPIITKMPKAKTASA